MMRTRRMDVKRSVTGENGAGLAEMTAVARRTGIGLALRMPPTVMMVMARTYGDGGWPLRLMDDEAQSSGADMSVRQSRTEGASAAKSAPKGPMPQAQGEAQDAAEARDAKRGGAEWQDAPVAVGLAKRSTRGCAKAQHRGAVWVYESGMCEGEFCEARSRTVRLKVWLKDAESSPEYWAVLFDTPLQFESDTGLPRWMSADEAMMATGIPKLFVEAAMRWA